MQEFCSLLLQDGGLCVILFHKAHPSLAQNENGEAFLKDYLRNGDHARSK